MASAFTHAVAAVALGSVMVPGRWRLIALGAGCAAAPDLDVLGFYAGIAYGDVLGHRGLSHSLPFALGAAAVIAAMLRGGSAEAPSGAPSPARTMAFLFLAIASHGLLDALTNGGRGVAFFAPFSAERHFLPWRPIEVSPISIRRFFTRRGLDILASELWVVWLPAAALAAIGALRRRARR